MKTCLKTALFIGLLAVMTACSAQKRAERHLRRAVALCPELVQMTAHPIDTVLTVPGWYDCTLIPMREMEQGATVYSATDHGTVVVKMRNDSTIRVAFIAAPQKLHYRDTLHFSQITLPKAEAEPKSGGSVWRGIGLVLLGCVVGIIGLLLIALKVKIQD